MTYTFPDSEPKKVPLHNCEYCKEPMPKKAYEDNYKYGKRRFCDPSCASLNREKLKITKPEVILDMV